MNISWNATSGGFYTVNQALPGSTGANYQVGDVITPVNTTGDTGTQPSFTVAAVTASGGITPNGLTVSGMAR